LASSSDKTSSDDKTSDKSTDKEDVLDAEVVEETDPSIDAVDEMADADGVRAESGGDESIEEVEEDNSDASLEERDANSVALVVDVPVQEPASRSIIPLIIGGLIAAGIGWMGARYIEPAGVTLADMSALRTTVKEQSAEISELTGALDTSQSTVAELTGEVGAMSELTTAQGIQIAELSKRIDARPVSTGNAELPADLAALLQAQKEEISSLQGNLKEMATFAEGQIQSAQEKSEAAERAKARATARDALNTVRLALASGEPFSDALGAISGAVDVPETLSSAADGIPTQAQLQDGFGAFARNALAASNRELAGDSAGERVGLLLQDLIGSRSLTPQEGDSPDAVLSRVEAAVRNGDISGALSTIEALPESGKAALSDWSDLAQARDGALTAFNELTDALSAD
jgi:hypothetical protein